MAAVDYKPQTAEAVTLRMRDGTIHSSEPHDVDNSQHQEAQEVQNSW